MSIATRTLPNVVVLAVPGRAMRSALNLSARVVFASSPTLEDCTVLPVHRGIRYLASGTPSCLAGGCVAPRTTLVVDSESVVDVSVSQRFSQVSGVKVAEVVADSLGLKRLAVPVVMISTEGSSLRVSLPSGSVNVLDFSFMQKILRSSSQVRLFNKCMDKYSKTQGSVLLMLRDNVIYGVSFPDGTIFGDFGIKLG